MPWENFLPKPSNNRGGCFMRLASVVAGFAMALAAALATAEIPNPTVTGPIPASAIPGDASHNYVFFASDHPLAVNGYVEEEFFINGAANRYLTSGTSTGTLQDSNHAYRTRIVVRRPADAKKFNGTVLVEWVNVTN